jgi:FixJ family two-component response regulator
LIRQILPELVVCSKDEGWIKQLRQSGAHLVHVEEADTPDSTQRLVTKSGDEKILLLLDEAAFVDFQELKDWLAEWGKSACISVALQHTDYRIAVELFKMGVVDCFEKTQYAEELRDRLKWLVVCLRSR